MKTALIVGMAKSGIGAAKLLKQDGWRVIVNDMKPEIPGLKEALSGYDVEYRLGEDPMTLLAGVDLVVPSPIIPMTRPFLAEARRLGAETISEIELGYRYAKAEFVCITGTNGKTTCTALTGEMFKNGYRGGRTFVLGNIGVAITEHALETRKGDIVVAETAALLKKPSREAPKDATPLCRPNRNTAFVWQQAAAPQAIEWPPAAWRASRPYASRRRASLRTQNASHRPNG